MQKRTLKNIPVFLMCTENIGKGYIHREGREARD